MTNCVQVLSREGFRLTGQRLQVIELLQRTGGHSTALEIFDALRRDQGQVSLATVYRTLSILESLKLVRRMDLSDRASLYELLEEGDSAHSHMICRRCGRIVDLKVPATSLLQELRNEAGLEHGFRVLDLQVVVYGICEDCQRRNQEVRFSERVKPENDQLHADRSEKTWLSAASPENEPGP